MAAGILHYEASAPEVNEWVQQYEHGGWDYLGGINQLARYSLLTGYLSFFGSRRILDVGCGTGLLRESMAGLDFDRYVGVDPVAVAIEQARRLADSRTEFVVGDANLPELSGFDAVVCNEILYCIPGPERLLDRARELLIPGGHLLISNMRHPGETALERMLSSRFELVGAVDVANDSDRGRRRRRVAAYTRS